MAAFWLAALAIGAGPSDVKTKDLGDGYLRVDTPSFTIEIPKAWKVSDETPWGARKVKPESGAGEMGTMTAAPTKASWDELYRTSLFFIQRESKGKPTPYEVKPTAQGYEACSFSILNEDGFAERRYVLLRSKGGRLLALNIRIPAKDQEKGMSAHFSRMVKTAKIKGD